MKKLQDVKNKLCEELESPPALRVFGSGWWSGAIGIILGASAVMGILCVWFPAFFPSLN